MKKAIFWLLLITTLILFSVPAFASTLVNVEGKDYTLETISRQGRILIPLRDTSNLLGAKVIYAPEANTAYIERYDNTLKIQFGDALSYLNNKVVSSGIPPVVLEGKAYVPLRFLAESLKYNVLYQDDKVYLESHPLAKIHYIDVGFGDAILIRLINNKNILIDSGADGTTATYLRQQGINKLDLVVSTTDKPEHMGGLPSILRGFTVNQIIDSNVTNNEKYYLEYKEFLQNKNILRQPAQKQVFSDDNIKFEVLSDYGQLIKQANKSIVSLLTVGSHSFLFMSDRVGQNELYDVPNHTINVLKVANHAGIESTSTEFLKRVKPEIAIITADYSKEGFPKGLTLKRINDIGAKIYSTGVNGTVVVDTDGKELQIEVEKEGNIAIIPEKDHELHNTTGLDYGNYIGDTRTGLYHHPNCQEVREISEGDKVWLIDKLQAEENGYIPDETCRPE